MALRGWAQRGWGCGQAWAPPVVGGCPELSAARAPRLLGRRLNLFLQQKCGFRKAPRKVEPRRSDTGSSGEAYKRSALIPPLGETVFYPSPYPIRTLVKPFFFTVGFTGCAFGSAAIWQYESLKSRVQSYFDGIKADWLDSIRPQKEGDLRKEINKWWNSLSDGQRTVTGFFFEFGNEDNDNYLIFNPYERPEKDIYHLSKQKCRANNFQNCRNDRDSWLSGQSPRVPLQCWGH